MWERAPGVHFRENKSALSLQEHSCFYFHGFSTKAQQPLKWDEAAAGGWGSKSPQVSQVGTMPAAGDTVYLEYYSAQSKASSNKPPPTIL